MRRAFDKLYGKIKPGSVALIFFSGFGIQSARQSYMIPIDAQIWTESDVRRDGFSLETVLGELNTRGAGVKIALVDASRRNPVRAPVPQLLGRPDAGHRAERHAGDVFGGAGLGGLGRGRRPQPVRPGARCKEIRVPDLMAEETLNRTKMGVTRASRGEQVPWISSSLAEDFSFIPGAGGSRPSVTPPPTGAAAVVANNPPPAPPAPPPPPTPADRQRRPRRPHRPVTGAITEAAGRGRLAPAATAGETADPGPAPSMDSGPSASALAEDPTIKGLTAKIAANPDDVNALYRRGQVYASKGAYNLAIKDFDDTLRINPKDVEALNNRCWTRTVVGDLQGALKDCNEALRLRPNFVDALDSRGLVNLKSGAVKNAIADFDAALKINPRLTSSLYGRGIAKQRNGSAQEGALDIANAKAMDPNIVQEFAELRSTLIFF